jgi:hypothetical protein
VFFIIIIIPSSHSINAIGPAPLRSGNKSECVLVGYPSEVRKGRCCCCWKELQVAVVAKCAASGTLVKTCNLIEAFDSDTSEVGLVGAPWARQAYRLLKRQAG